MRVCDDAATAAFAIPIAATQAASSALVRDRRADVELDCFKLEVELLLGSAGRILSGKFGRLTKMDPCVG